MDRLISEQAVIELIEFFQMNPQHFDFVNLIDDIKEIPSAEPKTGHWIPVSERLPEAGEYDGDVAKYYLVQNEYGDMLVARWDGKGWEQMYQHEYLEDDVIAWMPLPEPYKAESEG